ncbi:lactonase family protein [Microbacterium soli]|uniref:Lactonase family protein n=1 Tax=Microbacterium soli TaxID=446075 RepID=A0ABP7N547_9MICO
MSMHREVRVLVGGFTDGARADIPLGLAVHRVGADGEAVAEGRLVIDNPTWISPGSAPDLFYVSQSARRSLSLVGVDADGRISLVDQIDIDALNPAHVAVDPQGSHVIASCFSEGVIVKVRLRDDGGFAGVEWTRDMNRALASATRRNSLQSDAEPHQAVPIGAGEYFVPDRAQDVVWHLGPDGAAAPAAEVRPGAGPRHLALHPAAPVAYLVGELDSTLITFRREGRALVPVDVRTTLPADWFGDSAAAAIVVDAVRERVYVTNRGHDSVAVFDIRAPERPTSIGWIPLRGRTPRFAGLLADAGLLAVAAQGDDHVDLFRAEAAARLQGSDVRLVHAAPACVVQVQL